MILQTITLIFVIMVIIFLSVSFYIFIFGAGPFVPTPYKAAEKVLKYANISKGSILYDLGAGDGRYLNIAEKKYGAKATGFELNPFICAYARFLQIFFGWKGKIINGNFFKQDLSNADIIICYLLPKSLEKMQKKFEKELKKGCKIISYAFHIGDLKPIKVIPKQGKISKIMIYEI